MISANGLALYYFVRPPASTQRRLRYLSGSGPSKKKVKLNNPGKEAVVSQSQYFPLLQTFHLRRGCHLHLLPLLPRSPLIRQPGHNTEPHAGSQKQEHCQCSIKRELALRAQASKVAVAHVRGQSKILLQRLAVLVLARPGLNGVQLRAIVVEDMGIDDRHQGKKA